MSNESIATTISLLTLNILQSTMLGIKIIFNTSDKTVDGFFVFIILLITIVHVFLYLEKGVHKKMNEILAQKLSDEYREERDRLFKIGETIYGRCNCWNDGAGWYADTEIRKNKNYNKWAEGIEYLGNIQREEYSKYLELHPEDQTGDLNKDLLSAVGNYNAYLLDKATFKK